MISLYLRQNFRFNYQLLWSKQDQPAFAAFHYHFLTDECLPFIIDKQNEHPYFFKPDKITQQTMDIISFDPRVITENNFHDDNRPYRYEQNIQEQQNLSIYQTMTKTMKKTTIIMKNTFLRTKRKIEMKILHFT